MTTALVRTSVNFHGDPLEAIQRDGVTYAPVKPICDILGLDWEAQRQRIERDEVLSACTCMIQVQLPHDTQRREMICLPDEMLHGWLFGVEVKRVRPELRERLILYKRECYRVLHQAFTPAVAPAELTQLRQDAAELQRLRYQRQPIGDRRCEDFTTFIACCCDECREPDAFVSKVALYIAYARWAAACDRHVMSLSQFDQTAGMKLGRMRKNRRPVYWGIVLKEV